MYIVIAILAFGILIMVHELGHFSVSRWMNVKVNEFSIGMGPAIYKKQRGETVFALRALPLGGACVIEGEDGDSEDSRSFINKKLWQRLLILVAGSSMNFIIGFIIVAVIYIVYSFGGHYVSTTTLSHFMDGFPLEGQNGLMVGDKIISVDGHRTNTTTEFSLFMNLSNGETVDLVIKRDGKKIVLDDFPLTLREYIDEYGQKVNKYGLYFQTEQLNFFTALEQAWYRCSYYVRSVWISLGFLFSGQAGLQDVSGPVGVVSLMNEVGKQSAGFGEGLLNILFLVSFISINLGVMNLLPIPALDGGRIFFMYVFALIEKISRRKPNPKIEGYIHAAGFILLLGLMVVTLYNDIARLI
jgi:regulator of sigma E protease